MRYQEQKRKERMEALMQKIKFVVAPEMQEQFSDLANVSLGYREIWSIVTFNDADEYYQHITRNEQIYVNCGEVVASQNVYNILDCDDPADFETEELSWYAMRYQEDDEEYFHVAIYHPSLGE